MHRPSLIFRKNCLLSNCPINLLYSLRCLYIFNKFHLLLSISSQSTTSVISYFVWYFLVNLKLFKVSFLIDKIFIFTFSTFFIKILKLILWSVFRFSTYVFGKMLILLRFVNYENCFSLSKFLRKYWD